MRVEVRTTLADKARWQALAESRGLSLSDLVRALLDGASAARPVRTGPHPRPIPASPSTPTRPSRAPRATSALSR